MVSRSVCWTAIVWGGYNVIEWLVKCGHQTAGTYSAGELAYLTLDLLLIAIGIHRLILGARVGYSDEPV